MKYLYVSMYFAISHMFIVFASWLTITFSQIVNIMNTCYVAYLEELDFLHETCLTAMYSNRFVKFAAVLDNNGKLIIAEYRKGIQNCWRTDFISVNHYHRRDSSYLFHLDYLVPACLVILFVCNKTVTSQITSHFITLSNLFYA